MPDIMERSPAKLSCQRADSLSTLLEYLHSSPRARKCIQDKDLITYVRNKKRRDQECRQRKTEAENHHRRNTDTDHDLILQYRHDIRRFRLLNNAKISSRKRAALSYPSRPCWCKSVRNLTCAAPPGFLLCVLVCDIRRVSAATDYMPSLTSRPLAKKPSEMLFLRLLPLPYSFVLSSSKGLDKSLRVIADSHNSQPWRKERRIEITSLIRNLLRNYEICLWDTGECKRQVERKEFPFDAWNTLLHEDIFSKM